MTKEQALKVIEDVTAQINANRQTHAAIAQAIQVLKDDAAKPLAAVKG